MKTNEKSKPLLIVGKIIVLDEIYGTPPKCIYYKLDRKSHPQDQNHFPKDVMNVSIFASLQAILRHQKYVITECPKESCWAPDVNPRWTHAPCMFLNLRFHIWWCSCISKARSSWAGVCHAHGTLPHQVGQNAKEFILTLIQLENPFNYYGKISTNDSSGLAPS